MKNAIKKFIVSAMALAVLFASNTSLVEAKEANADTGVVYEQSADAVARANQDKTYNFGRSTTSYHVGPVIVTDSSTLRLIMPNNNGKSYMQGNVSFTPMTGGKSIDIRYANYSTQDYMVPLDTVEPGAYFLYISGAVVGSSGQASVRLIYNEL